MLCNIIISYNKMKVGIVGSLHFNDYSRFSNILEDFIKIHGKPTTIISGGCSGADKLAERWAQEHSILINIYYAEWGKYGKAAGLKRNVKIIEQSDYLIAFPSRTGKGTQHSISLATRKGIPLIISYVD